MSITLDNRLAAVADFVRSGARLCDVGTDHAYVPAYLVTNGKIISAIGCDINEQPLRSAERTLRQNDITSVQLRLCDGLSAVAADECDDIVVAGMGGELIADIITAAPWLKDPRYRLILQPMSKADRLRRFLCNNGFVIERENAVCANDKHYSVMCVSYSGECRHCDTAYALVGELGGARTNEAKGYREAVLRRLRKKAQGLSISGADIGEINAVIEQIEAMK